MNRYYVGGWTLKNSPVHPNLRIINIHQINNHKYLNTILETCREKKRLTEQSVSLVSHQVRQYVPLCVFNHVRDVMIELAFSSFHFAFCVCMFQFLICTINYYNLDTTSEKKKHCHSPNGVLVWKLNDEFYAKLLKPFFRHYFWSGFLLTTVTEYDCSKMKGN